MTPPTLRRSYLHSLQQSVPNADFVELKFINPSNNNIMNLFFETDLLTFAGNTFYTQAVIVSTGAGISQLVFLNGFSNFSSGSATLVPEPSTWAMLVVGFAGLGYAGWRRAKAAPSAA